jgi:hypothetical protein
MTSPAATAADPRNRLCECDHRFSRKHYLSEYGIQKHIEIEHGSNKIQEGKIWRTKS